jgi:hypothetical protein
LASCWLEGYCLVVVTVKSSIPSGEGTLTPKKECHMIF